MTGPTSSNVAYNYGDTTPDDAQLAAAARPGAKSQLCYADAVASPVSAADVAEWVAAMKGGHGIGAVVSLLSDDEVANTYAPPGVEAAMAGAFGADNYVRFDGKRLGQGASTAAAVLGAIDARVAAGRKVLVHCWGGGGRSGLVQAAWLARRRGLSAADAAAAVVAHAKALGVPRRVDVAALEAFLATA